MIVKLRMRENPRTAIAVDELARELSGNVIPGSLQRNLSGSITTQFQFPSEQDAEFFAENVKKMADVVSAHTIFEEALEF